MRAKQIIFDGLYGTYTLVLILYVLAPKQFNEEFFLANFSALLGVGALITLASMASTLVAKKLNIVTLGDHLFLPRHQSDHRSRRATYAHLGAVFLLTVYVSLIVTGASLRDLFDRDGLGGAWRMFRGLTHPALNLIPKAIAQTSETILIAFLATVLAIPFAFLASFFAAKNLTTKQRAFYFTLRTLLNIGRSVEPLIWALIFTVWVGVGPFAGMLALMVHSLASLTKYYSEIIEDVSEGPIDAIRSTGASHSQVILYAIVPQVLLPFTAMTFYRWDTNVRMATVIGLVGGGGIGTLLLQYQGQGMWPEVGSIILVIAIIVWLMDFASAQIRAALK